MKIYLAIPYSGIEEQSFNIANRVASMLMAQGHIVYSPISHNHPIAIAHGLPTGWDFWERFDTEFIKWCDEVHVIDIHCQVYPVGHQLVNASSQELRLKSKGVQAELKLAAELCKPIVNIEYHGITT